MPVREMDGFKETIMKEVSLYPDEIFSLQKKWQHKNSVFCYLFTHFNWDKFIMFCQGSD